MENEPTHTMAPKRRKGVPSAEDFLSRRADRIWQFIRRRYRRGILSLPTYDDCVTEIGASRETVALGMKELREKGRIP